MWSGGRDSNPQLPVWKTGTLPLSYLRLASSGGFEPPTRGLEGRCSIQLSYEDLVSIPYVFIPPDLHGDGWDQGLSGQMITSERKFITADSISDWM